MYRKNRSNIAYILFWLCMLLVLGVFAFFIFNYKDIMDWSFYSKNRSTQDDSRVLDTFPDTMGMEKFSQMDTPTSMSDEPSNATKYEALFAKGTLTPTGMFVNENGTVFSVGKIYFTGKFPEEFNIAEDLPSTNVSVTFSFGWKNLPRFDELKNVGRESNIELELEPLDVLDVDISIINTMTDNQTTINIKNAIKDYVYSLFKNQVIPSDMVHVAQQRLSSAYILKNYNNVEFTTSNY